MSIVSSAMGLTQSSVNSHRVVRKSKDKEVFLEPHHPPELLEFSPRKSFMVSYGLDYQSSPKFKHKTLTAAAGYDAVHIASVFQKVGEFDMKAGAK